MREDPIARAAFRNATLIGWFLVLQPIIFVAAAFLVRRLGASRPQIDPSLLRVLLPVFYGLTILCVGAAVLFRRVYLDPRKATPVTAPARFVSGTITSLAIVEQPGVFGLVLFLLGGSPLHLAALAAISVASMVALLPRSAGFEEFLEHAGRG